MINVQILFIKFLPIDWSQKLENDKICLVKNVWIFTAEQVVNDIDTVERDI